MTAPATINPRKPKSWSVLSRDAPARRRPSNHGWVWRQAVEQDRSRLERDEDEVLEVPAGQEQGRRVGAPRDAIVGRIVGRSRRARSRPGSRPNQTWNVSPSRRRASRPNWAIIAQREGVQPTITMKSVRGPVLLPTSSSQTKKTKPTIAGQRPIAAGYSATDQPSKPTARSTARRVVDRRERVDPVPDRADERGQHRHADPAVDPQEQRRDVARRSCLPAIPQRDDPDPADSARGRGRSTHPGRRDLARRQDRRIPPGRRRTARRRTTAPTAIAAPAG